MKREKYVIIPYIIEKDNDTKKKKGPKIVTPQRYVTDFDG